MPITKNKLTDATGVSQAALDALERDADLLVCTECATQYPNSRADCECGVQDYLIVTLI